MVSVLFRKISSKIPDKLFFIILDRDYIRKMKLSVMSPGPRIYPTLGGIFLEAYLGVKTVVAGLQIEC